MARHRKSTKKYSGKHRVGSTSAPVWKTPGFSFGRRSVGFWS